MSAPADEGLPHEPSTEVRTPTASADAADALQDPACSLHRFRVQASRLALFLSVTSSWEDCSSPGTR